jgi:nicotinamidase/pyrazinamidase
MGNAQSSNNKVSPATDANKFILGIIDVQEDFCKGGALAVGDADSIVARINKFRFTYCQEMMTFVTEDCHPVNHMSFCTTHANKAMYDKITYETTINGDRLVTEQTLWPKHCVRGTNGARLHGDLVVTNADIRIKKGEMAEVESYSAFGDEFGNKYEQTPLHTHLKENNITDIVLVGVATEYCVYYTALDALRLGYTVHLILSCTRGVAKDTTKAAIDDLLAKRVNIYETLDEFYNYFKTTRGK